MPIKNEIQPLASSRVNPLARNPSKDVEDSGDLSSQGAPSGDPQTVPENRGPAALSVGNIASRSETRHDPSAGGGKLVVPGELAAQIDAGEEVGDTIRALTIAQEKPRTLTRVGRQLKKSAEFNRMTASLLIPIDMDLLHPLVALTILPISGPMQAAVWLTHGIEKLVRGRSRVTGRIFLRDIKPTLDSFEEATGAAKVLMGRAAATWLDKKFDLHPKAREALRDVKTRTHALPEDDHERADRVTGALEILRGLVSGGIRSPKAVVAVREALAELEGEDLVFAQGLFRAALPQRELSPGYLVTVRDRGCMEQEMRYLLGLELRPDPGSTRAQSMLERFRAADDKTRANIIIKGGSSAGVVVYSVVSEAQLPERYEYEGEESGREQGKDMAGANAAARHCFDTVPRWKYIPSGYSSFHSDERIFEYEFKHLESVSIAGERVGYRAYLEPVDNGYNPGRKHWGYIAFDAEGNYLGRQLRGDRV